MPDLLQSTARQWWNCSPTFLQARATSPCHCLRRLVKRSPSMSTRRSPCPPFANSQMDGFAVHSADIPDGGAELKVAEPVPAGAAPEALKPGFAAPPS